MIPREDVARIAELARLEIPEAAMDKTRAELSAVLAFVAQLQKLDLSGCEPHGMAPEGTPLREDHANGRRLATDVALAGAPEAEDGFFLVPPIVENVNP